MKSNPKLGLSVSLIVLVGVPVIFLIISLLTKEWNYLVYSIIPSLFAGLTGLMISVHPLKKEKRT
ncbi:TPA: hypothetical protein G9C53_005036 [Salmonella enterica subsp. enterica serovar Typhimurium var. 5-]|jgi:hypothetical protein|uniref:Uncharacterized protein n=1 Tax=Salmonella enterica subsp. enterica serovar Typhimurium var. 5- TaxID=1620419 RepID=A0A740PMQ9_SALTM|nr:hypothetical protein [Salmonella enterica subsp. enterica serovar Typhimurium var. 5-]